MFLAFLRAVFTQRIKGVNSVEYQGDGCTGRGTSSSSHFLQGRPGPSLGDVARAPEIVVEKDLLGFGFKATSTNHCYTYNIYIYVHIYIYICVCMYIYILYIMIIWFFYLQILGFAAFVDPFPSLEKIRSPSVCDHLLVSPKATLI